MPEDEAPQKNPAAVELGRRGGLKGGKARAAALTSEQRREIASTAARARWAKQRAVSPQSPEGSQRFNALKEEEPLLKPLGSTGEIRSEREGE